MKKILIVDDSSLARRMMRKILEDGGYQVIEATDGMAACEQYMLGKPDLVTLDLSMTGMSGLDVLAKLRELDPKARVVVASADVQTSSRQMAMDEGASAFVNKPFKNDEVLAAIAEALGR